MPDTDHPNRELLDAVNARAAWFPARKTAPLWARRLETAEAVATREGHLQARPGDFLCRGPAGDTWPQGADTLEAKYEPTDEVDAEGFRKYTPRPEGSLVLAARMERPFGVQSRWGPMSGAAGDYLVKRHDARDEAYPDDVWIVSAEVFEASYERTGDE